MYTVIDSFFRSLKFSFEFLFFFFFFCSAIDVQIKSLHFKTQPGPVAKNATPSPPAGNLTREPRSLDQRSTNWATETVAVSLGVSSVHV